VNLRPIYKKLAFYLPSILYRPVSLAWTGFFWAASRIDTVHAILLPMTDRGRAVMTILWLRVGPSLFDR